MKKITANEIINNLNTKKVYVMGYSANGHAADVRKLIDIEGYIDDFCKDDFIDGKPISKQKDVDKGSIIIVCSTVRPISALRSLKENGFEYIIDYPSLYRHLDKELKNKVELNIIKDFKIEYSKNKLKYDKLKANLADEESKVILQSIIDYRLTLDIKHTSGFEYKPSEQYFPEFIEYKENEVFVDAGAYDGHTSIEFIKKCPNYNSIYIFEPDAENITKAKENLISYSGIYFHCIGLSNSSNQIRFDAGKGATSSISLTGSSIIKVDSLDTIIKEKITYLKMDIEGEEINALEGSKTKILECHPKLAISVYHRI